MSGASTHDEFIELWGGSFTFNARAIYENYLILARAENVVHFCPACGPNEDVLVGAAIKRHQIHHSNTLLQKLRSKLQLSFWRTLPGDLVEEDSQHGRVSEMPAGLSACGFHLSFGRFHFALSVGCVEPGQRSACTGAVKAASGHRGGGRS
jgi:hypothetical protein